MSLPIGTRISQHAHTPLCSFFIYVAVMNLDDTVSAGVTITKRTTVSGLRLLTDHQVGKVQQQF